MWLMGLGVLTLVSFLIFAVESGLGSRTIPRLAALAGDCGPLPSVSIIIAARDEAARIEGALESVLALDYPDFEVLAVNDRSTDGTGEILRRMERTRPHLRVMTVGELPAGWLGKNHALDAAAKEARGELLLFTDADIVYEPTALRRAVCYLLREEIDHLTVTPEMHAASVPVGMFVAAFGVFFSVYSRPWRARNRSVRDHVGVGAFNLVRAAFYRRIGGHQPIRMRPDDDMMLGKLVKKCGGRQAIAFGRGMLRVEWYATIPEAIEGLEKNAFTGVSYSLPLLAGATAAQCALYLWPFVALFATHGAVRGVNAAIAALILVMTGSMCRMSGLTSPLYAIGFPLATVLFVLILWRASLKATMAGGILWRETFYPLDQLRANRI
jgi:glycosyltransferase involved in cell wall biosynthesis